MREIKLLKYHSGESTSAYFLMALNVTRVMHKPLLPHVLLSWESHREILVFIRDLLSDHSSYLLTLQNVTGRYCQYLIACLCSFIIQQKKGKWERVASLLSSSRIFKKIYLGVECQKIRRERMFMINLVLGPELRTAQLHIHLHYSTLTDFQYLDTSSLLLLAHPNLSFSL